MNLTTEQEVFDFVVESLIKQGRPSAILNEGEPAHCLYRDKKGAKCAVGHLITDEEIASIPLTTIENQTIGEIGQFLPSNHVVNRFPELSSLLQSAHDNAAQRMVSVKADFVVTFKENAKYIVDCEPSLVWRFDNGI